MTDRAPNSPGRLGQHRFCQAIIGQLEPIRRRAGLTRRQLFGDWTDWVIAFLEQLPDRLAWDRPPDLPPGFRARYADPDWVQLRFGAALQMLVRHSRPGLWAAPAAFGACALGPDLIGACRLAYVPCDAEDPARPVTPWSTWLRRARQHQPDGLGQVLARLVAACQAPNNAAGRAALQQRPADPAALSGWLFEQLLPAARPPYYVPLRLTGSGSTWLLALARQYPRWAVIGDWVEFVSPAEAGRLEAAMSGINERLFGLNGYHLRLAEALRADPHPDPALRLAPEIERLLAVVPEPVSVPAPRPDDPGPTFEQLFRRRPPPAGAA